MLRQDGSEPVARHIHHDTPTGSISTAITHGPLCCECLCWPAVICDAVICLGGIILDALLCTADGMGEQGVDARVLSKGPWEGSTAGGAVLLALCCPALEAVEAEVVLAGALQMGLNSTKDRSNLSKQRTEAPYRQPAMPCRSTTWMQALHLALL